MIVVVSRKVRMHACIFPAITDQIPAHLHAGRKSRTEPFKSVRISWAILIGASSDGWRVPFKSWGGHGASVTPRMESDPSHPNSNSCLFLYFSNSSASELSTGDGQRAIHRDELGLYPGVPQPYAHGLHCCAVTRGDHQSSVTCCHASYHATLSHRCTATEGNGTELWPRLPQSQHRV